ncbi:MAG TPA: hypothetical protein VNF07_02790 [Acidimicrobiales bacterium]|nr:hypothetical protein [Acidimicrobiales bacterium]
MWVLGEGLGGVASGFGGLAFGSPGPALLYAALAAVLFCSLGGDPAALGARLRRVWAVVLAAGLLLEAASPYPASLRLRADYQSLAVGEPAALARVDRALGAFTSGHALAVTLGLLAVELTLLLAVARPLPQAALAAVLCLLGAFWLLGENLGGLFTGSANDPGEMPLLALVAVGAFRVAPRYAFGMRVDRRQYTRLARPGTPVAP